MAQDYGRGPYDPPSYPYGPSAQGMSQPVNKHPQESGYGASPGYPYPPQPPQVVVNVHQHMQQAQAMPLFVAQRISLKARWGIFLESLS